MSPFGLETLPAETLKLLRTVPLIAERLREVASHTSVLAALNQQVRGIGDAVEPLERIDETVGRIARDTGALPQVCDGIGELGEGMTAMDRRMATIEDAMPVLVEVQQHLAKLPETMQSLDSGIGGLTELLTRLVASIETLDANVAALQESIEPVGRLADKLPGSSRRD